MDTTTHAAGPHEDEEKFKQLFREADARIVAALEKKAGAGTFDEGTYSYGGKKITITCIGCEEPIAKTEAARKLLESLAGDMSESFMKDGLARLIEMVKRDEAQARERSFMHHHFPTLLDAYDALIR